MIPIDSDRDNGLKLCKTSDLPMKSFKVLVNIRAFNEEDMREQLDSLDCYELEWWCETQ